MKKALLLTLFISISLLSISKPLEIESQLPYIPQEIIEEFGEINIENAEFSESYHDRKLVKIPFLENNSKHKKFLTISFDAISMARTIYRVLEFSSDKELDEIKSSNDFGSGYISIDYLNEGFKTTEQIVNNETVITNTSERPNFDLFSSGNMPCVKSCYAKTLKEFNPVEWAICIANIPECVAGIFLVCEWNCIFDN